MRKRPIPKKFVSCLEAVIHRPFEEEKGLGFEIERLCLKKCSLTPQMRGDS